MRVSGCGSGKDVNAIGLICDKLIMPSRMLFCQGGGMAVQASVIPKLSILIDFKAAPQSSRAAIPARGECAWQDSPVAPNEPKRLYVPIKNEMKPLVEAAQKGGIFLIQCVGSGRHHPGRQNRQRECRVRAWRAMSSKSIRVRFRNSCVPCDAA